MSRRLNRPKLRRSKVDTLTFFHCETIKVTLFYNCWLMGSLP